MSVPQDITTRLDRVHEKADLFERICHLIEKEFPPPLFYHSGQQHFGFRFGDPDIRHFCFLKLVRVVSALRAGVILAKAGYTQEVFVLLRTLMEFDSHIEYVLLMRDARGHSTEEVETYLESYFADFARNTEADFGKIKLKQGAVHEAVGNAIDQVSEAETPPADPARKLMKRVYGELSNYVHGRYPEIMDLYGGDPGRWHLSGMAGTPKDSETVAFLETSTVTISQTCKIIADAFGLQKNIQADALLASWYDQPD